LRLQACHAAWATTIFRGKAAGSREYVRQALALYDRDAHRGHALLYGGHDPAVCGLGVGAATRLPLGS